MQRQIGSAKKNVCYLFNFCTSFFCRSWMYAIVFFFDRADFPDLFLVLFLCKISRLQLRNHLLSLWSVLSWKNSKALRSFPIIALVKSSARYLDVWCDILNKTTGFRCSKILFYLQTNMQLSYFQLLLLKKQKRLNI